MRHIPHARPALSLGNAWAFLWALANALDSKRNSFEMHQNPLFPARVGKPLARIRHIDRLGFRRFWTGVHFDPHYALIPRARGLMCCVIQLDHFDPFDSPRVGYRRIILVR